MAHLHKVLLILTLFFLAVNAKHRRHKRKNPHLRIPLLPIPHLPPLPFTQEPSDDNNNFPGQNDKDDQVIGGGEENKGDFNMVSFGHWELISENSGVSAMHINLLPTNKIIVFDSKIYRNSRLKLQDGVPCLPYKDANQNDQLDCAAHSMEYDIETNQVRPLKIGGGDPWCSSGGLAPDGTLVGSGGFLDGGKTLRFIGGPDCQDCQWREYDNALAEERWYGTQQLLPNGDFIVIGGRRSFSYELLPKEGQKGEKPYFFPFLYETSDFDENNLYPFVHLSTDGNLFIFSNNRSLLLNPTTHKIVRTFPVLLGGSRNYPASGMSALLPIDLNAATLKAEVIVCGGNLPNAFELAETKKIFLPALQDCNRLTISEQFPEWDRELMPSRRTMGDALILPNGELLLINGAQVGTAAWWDADAPNYTPVLYSPLKPKGLRFRVLKPSQIARMYHSTSAVLPSGKIWVGGSNTHDRYKDQDKFPTETRVEAFSPPYLDAKFDKYRPQINEFASDKELRYGGYFETQFSVEDQAMLTLNDIKVTMYSPPFTTHGFSMGQRLLYLKTENIMTFEGFYRVRLVAPPSGEIAPPGYYLLFVVHRGLPGKGMWVHIQ
ncbi:aldehyde oxidase GLOX1-like [Gastrolobium bilobum]|uniref:aldehyde oxidase GLOX1-like n=1 Tax=Gastrolobium bilobum TaxID=150636 RepID=UPI002AB031E9|nr:aldehyde oxidase GLOX1-like [Gastrolobium bilobum]XP_061343819.1 aldehyde oxidase GLOX1-like [Gastrolobium bilobum]XP_061364080.1 aldehyde oxidase GLOX1-like [Gastrolobium bilobum]